MGSGQSTARKAANAHNDEIDAQLDLERIQPKSQVRVLMLSAGGSNKHRLSKRMKYIQDGGYNNQEREAYKKVIFSSTIQYMRVILEAMPHFNLQLAPQNDTHKAVILTLPGQIETDGDLPPEVADAVQGLWHDSSVQKAVRRSSTEFGDDDLDPAMYYLNAIDRITGRGYLPTDQDILHRPIKNTGITEITFKVGELNHQFLDLGGQRGQRRKWIHCFEGVVEALVFHVSLNEYDQMLREDESTNCLQAALTEFDSVCNSQWFTRTSIILFLDDTDLFAEKLRDRPLEDYFPDYTGRNNHDAACDYILHRFVSLNMSANSKQIYAHYTNSSDTGLMKFMFSAIQDILLQQDLRAKRLL